MKKVTQSEFDAAHELHKKWLKSIEGGVRMDFRNADLSRCDLSGCDLSGCDLRGRNLSGCDLSGCDLSRCDLSGCDLSRCDLSRCDLSRCDLSGCDLSGCDLPSSHSYAQISFDGHGERGRKITVFKTPEKVTYSCGCFVGTEQELRDYIDLGAEQHRESRRYALTCLIGALEISERRKAV